MVINGHSEGTYPVGIASQTHFHLSHLGRSPCQNSFILLAVFLILRHPLYFIGINQYEQFLAAGKHSFIPFRFCLLLRRNENKIHVGVFSLQLLIIFQSLIAQLRISDGSASHIIQFFTAFGLRIFFAASLHGITLLVRRFFAILIPCANRIQIIALIQSIHTRFPRLSAVPPTSISEATVYTLNIYRMKAGDI